MPKEACEKTDANCYDNRGVQKRQKLNAEHKHHSFPDFQFIMRIPSSLSLTSLRTFVCGRHVCRKKSRSESARGRRRRLPPRIAYLVGLPESQQLVSEQFPHLRIFDDAA